MVKDSFSKRPDLATLLSGRWGRTSGRTAIALALACVCALFASTAHASAAGCFTAPSSCGYPDATNTGVPAGTTLTPSSSRTVTTNGTVLSGLEITGTVIVAADDVTIKNSRIRATTGGSGSYAVQLNNGADNFTIEHTEVLGPTSETSGLESAVWNHYGNPGVTARYDYFHKCADCWEGPGVFENDYMVVDAAYNGSHDEDIYVCGDSVKVEHSTLYNTHHQTATVFGDTAGCGGNNIEIKNSLLAGGGYMLYPQGNASSSTGTMNITNNRFARCISGTAYDSSTGGTYCASNRAGDTSGYYPYGGFYGLAAYYFTGGANVWTNNVWDDNSKPTCPTGNEGCGVVTPPPTGPPVETPVTEPPVTVPPVEEPTKEPEAPSGGGGTPTPLEAIFTVADEIVANVPTVLDGTDSTGPGSLTCTWSIQTANGTDTPSGCRITYVFTSAGAHSVKLTVHSSHGGTDSSKQAVTVLAARATGPGSGTSPSSNSPTTSTHSPGSGSNASHASALGNGTVVAGGGSDARSAWKAPAHVRAGHRLPLVAAVGNGSATCTWRVVERRPGRDWTAKRKGCSTSLRAPGRGTLRVRLKVTAADGTVSTARHTIAVGPRAASGRRER
jgi:hypothetical protein